MRLFNRLDWQDISELIQQANAHVTYAAPGLDDTVASALINASIRLGKKAVSVVLDTEPECFRLGYGLFEPISMLRAEGLKVRNQPGLRVGLIVCDHDAWSFSMPPLLVEKLSNENINAFRLTRDQAEGAMGAISETSGNVTRGSKGKNEEPEIGRVPLDDHRERVVRKALEADPPQRFDISQKVRVFNSKVEFVELELRGLNIAQRRVTLPNDLVVAVEDKATRERIRAAYKVVENPASIGSEEINREIATIRDTYLKSVHDYGRVILRSSRSNFEEDLREIRKKVEVFKENIARSLSREVDNSIANLVNAFIFGITNNPPRQLLAQVNRVTEENARRWIEAKLRDAFPKPQSLINDISIKCVFKGVTYEALADTKFQEAIKKLFPFEDWDTPLTEFDAAPGESPM